MRRFFCGVLILFFTVPLLAMPQRIISLAPNLTEILFAIGAGKNIVGVSVDSDYPQVAKQIPIVANAGQLNLEAIIAAKPTMIIAWRGGNPEAQLQALKKFNFQVYTFQFNKVSDITNAMAQLGKLTGHENQANNQIQQFNQQLQLIKHIPIPNQTSAPKVLYLLWQIPLMTVGNNTLINQAIQLCGGQNIFADLNISAPVINIASVLQRNPAVIIAGFNSKHWKDTWQPWPQILAVKFHRLYYINPDLLQRPGPRFVQGVAELCRVIDSSDR